MELSPVLMTSQTWKVGELAEKAGLSVRALHHYDELGLLSPSLRTPSGHRLYTDADLARLAQIVSLKNLGFSLEKIKEALQHPDFSPVHALQMHLRQMREQLTAMSDACEKLEGITRLAAHRNVSGKEFLDLLGLLHRVAQSYSGDDMAYFEKRRKEVGMERIQEVENEWPKLMAAVQAEMDKGTPPASPKVKKLAKKWMSLVKEFTGGNPEIAAKVKKMYEDNPDAAAQFGGPGKEMRNYIQQALGAGR